MPVFGILCPGKVRAVRSEREKQHLPPAYSAFLCSTLLYSLCSSQAWFCLSAGAFGGAPLHPLALGSNHRLQRGNQSFSCQGQWDLSGWGKVSV